MVNNNNGWTEWSNHVLISIKDLDGKVDKLSREISSLREDIIILKVKAGVWGMFGGAIPAIIGFAIYFLKNT